MGCGVCNTWSRQDFVLKIRIGRAKVKIKKNVKNVFHNKKNNVKVVSAVQCRSWYVFRSLVSFYPGKWNRKHMRNRSKVLLLAVSRQKWICFGGVRLPRLSRLQRPQQLPRRQRRQSRAGVMRRIWRRRVGQDSQRCSIWSGTGMVQGRRRLSGDILDSGSL